MARDLRGLNWGCGPVLAEGWWNSDIVDYGQDHVGSILDRLPYDDGFFDGIVANHSLQSLTVHEVPVALAEFRRLLRSGGHLRVLVPDVVAAFGAYLDSEPDWPGFAAISEPWSIDRKLAHYLTWGGQNRSCFTPISLAWILDEAGFLPCVPRPWLWELDSREGESLVIEVGSL